MFELNIIQDIDTCEIHSFEINVKGLLLIAIFSIRVKN